MRATGQAASLTGQLQEHERRLVLARALLGEWLGGSGGGWQDSGGVWPGMKLIEGVLAGEGDPEFGISRGRLMPQHRILDRHDASPETRRKLQDSLVLVHGGMAQNVGPILEMVTEKYLLRCDAEWKARQSMLGILDEILAALRGGRRARASARRPRGISSSPSRRSSPGPPITSPKRSSSGCGPSSARISGASGCWAACPAAAWASSSRRSRKPRAQERLQEIMSADQTRTAARPALRHGAGGL